MKEFAWGVCNDDMGHNYASTSGNRRSLEIEGTALGKCLQAWPVYNTGPGLRVYVSRFGLAVRR